MKKLKYLTYCTVYDNQTYIENKQINKSKEE